MKNHPFRLLRPALLLAALLAAPALRAQTEGYDPMRQITEQLVNANLLIVQDVTGSMRWDDAGNPLSYAENSTGNLFWNQGCYYDQRFPNDPDNPTRWYGCGDETGRWGRSVRGRTIGVENRTVPQDGREDCVGDSCRVWTYVLTFEKPSRLAIVKNAMGDAVHIVESYVPPPFFNGVAAATGAASWTRANDLGTPFLGDWGTLPNYATVSVFRYDPAKQSQVRFWVYTIDYGKNNVGAVQRKTDPGRPLNVWQTAASTDHRPGINVAGTGCALAGSSCSYVKAKDVIGQNANRVNWGLLPYSSNNQNFAAGRVGVIDVDPSGTNPGLANIKNAYRLNQRTAYGIEGNSNGPALAPADGHAMGLIARGGTNTRYTLYRSDADGATNKGANNSLNRTRAAASNCPAPYGVILVTDGESNSGNPSDATWSSCYDDAASYPAGSAHALYNLFGRRPIVNTWAIGISPDVGACELNFTSYAGRTDASSPRGDAGYSGYAPANPAAGDLGNPYVAEATANVADAGSPASPGSFSSHYDPSHGHNAFFPTDSTALGNAIAAIVNATATGDYATNAPVSGMAVSNAFANTVYLPSTEFPSWKGHVYAYDLSKYTVNPTTGVRTWTKNPLYPDFPHWLVWDAGQVLKTTPAASRKIFTWNPTTNALVEVSEANLTTLRALGVARAGDLTIRHIDFIRGNKGSCTAAPCAEDARPWRLGPLINSTPALVGPPGVWLQATTPRHGTFEYAKSGRTPLLWVGSNDGMLHGFRISDGKEQIALLPPSLISQQVQLFESYVADPRSSSGQPYDPAAHLYGVANSFRFGDVYMGSTTGYRTLGIISLGAGGSELTAIDVTDVPRPEPPVPADPTYTYPANPVTIVWTKTPTSLPGLDRTWSIPAMSPVGDGTAWRLIVGDGYDSGNTAATQTSGTGFEAPRSFSLNPADGTLLATNTLTTTTGNGHGNFVGNQAFADAVLFSPDARFYQEDNLSKLGLQADLNGRIWFLTSNNATRMWFDDAAVGIDASAKAGQSQPLYYNPAASGYGQGSGAGCVAYAFGSGSLYEKSPAVTGPSSTFVPRLYVATARKTSWNSAVPSTQIVDKALATTWTVQNADESTRQATFSARTQLTGPPFLLVPRSGTGTSTALFLLYDPNEGCYGNSYVAKVDFEGSTQCAPTVATDGYRAFDAGAGAASGFTIAGTKVLVSKSGVGQGQKAGLFEPPGISAATGPAPDPKVKWWKELK